MSSRIQWTKGMYSHTNKYKKQDTDIYSYICKSIKKKAICLAGHFKVKDKSSEFTTQFLLHCITLVTTRVTRRSAKH